MIARPAPTPTERRLSRDLDVEHRQAALLARSALLRQRLATESLALEQPLALVDRTRGTLAWLWCRRLPLAAGLAGLAAVRMLRRPRRSVGWIGALYSIWNLGRRALPWIALTTRVARPLLHRQAVRSAARDASTATSGVVHEPR